MRAHFLTIFGYLYIAFNSLIITFGGEPSLIFEGVLLFVGLSSIAHAVDRATPKPEEPAGDPDTAYSDERLLRVLNEGLVPVAPAPEPEE